MIYDLDKTLSTLLLRELREEFVDQVEISFAAPDDAFPPQSVTLPAIDLFLYDLRENLELRESEAWVERAGDATALSRPAPVRVDASYLITAWPRPTVTDPAKDEHHLLGEVMRALLRHRALPQDVLQGELLGQALPPPVAMLQPGRLQSVGEFWQALGGKPKAALNYTVTLALEAGPARPVKLVTDKRIRVGLQPGGRP
ncbi:DUF4255 domain-containing protein [Massilia sp. IC2-278]|uniref:DUF4255 domain-containing protein n=1 Tax=Massilia sp. IC2-278 TaxID=2887200 RepID=UPI001E3B21F5|nr:DUF4255 domain-containing protein [Massilia sp. IC2-278]MCC2959344.1 DUF4255 domain-containing protein [Massilia sp. IC2-278]